MDTKVSWQELANSAKVFGHEYVSNGVGSDASCLLRGDMTVHELEPGLLLYRTHVMDHCDIRTSHVLNPSLKVLLLLDGCTQLRYGRDWSVLDASHGPRGLLVNLTQEDVFMRQWKTGQTERKLVLSVEPRWMEHKGILQSLPCLQQHLARSRWQPSRKSLALAEQLHHEAAQKEPPHSLQRLQWLAKAQTILEEALEIVMHRTSPQNQTEAHSIRTRQTKGLSVQAYRNLVALREWLATSASDGLSIQAISKHAGMSVSYLQRYFGEVAYGQSVVQFLRSQRLHRACLALEREGVSVARAAEIAGYASVTHFAKAFRQAYGCAPSQWRSGA